MRLSVMSFATTINYHWSKASDNKRGFKPVTLITEAMTLRRAEIPSASYSLHLKAPPDTPACLERDMEYGSLDPGHSPMLREWEFASLYEA
jgi:hypothetical protein